MLSALRSRGQRETNWSFSGPQCRVDGVIGLEVALGPLAPLALEMLDLHELAVRLILWGAPMNTKTRISIISVALPFFAIACLSETETNPNENQTSVGGGSQGGAAGISQFGAGGVQPGAGGNSLGNGGTPVGSGGGPIGSGGGPIGSGGGPIGSGGGPIGSGGGPIVGNGGGPLGSGGGPLGSGGGSIGNGGGPLGNGGGPLGSGGDPIGNGGGPLGSGGDPIGNGGGPLGSGGEIVGGGGDVVGNGGNQGVGGDGVGGEPVVEPELVTSADGDYWNDDDGRISDATGNAGVVVHDDRAVADWYGLGGTFNEKGWDALLHLSEEDRATAMRLLFDVRDGIGFTYGRIPIGASDYGMNRYTLDDVSNGTDYEMQQFSIERDRELLIPFILAAKAIKSDIKFWGSPWTAPPWMKTNNAYDRGNMKEDSQTLDAHALYLARFVQAYGEEGIDIFAVHPQNEPGYAQDYPSCGWPKNGGGYLYASYIKNHLAPTFEREGVTAEIWLGTLSNASADNSLGQEVMNDSGARALIKGVGLQWAMSAHIGSYVGQGLHVMQTEHQCGNYPWNGGNANRAPNDYAYANESWTLIRDWIRAKVNSYSAWNMVLDTVGRNLDEVRPWAQNALLAVDVNQGQLIVTPTYWLFRHVGQYVDPGAKQVEIEGTNDGFAFKNPDGSVVTILHNSGGQPAQTVLSAAGRTVQFTIPGGGWATVNLQ